MLDNPLRKIRLIADYQFGKGLGDALFPEEIEITFSRRTGRIRYIYLKGELLATLRPTNGLFSLTIEGARRTMKVESPRLWVMVQDDVSNFIAKGRSVFAKHVDDCDEEIRPEEEVVVVDNKFEVLAVGRAVLTGREMKHFKKGVAVRVRRGAAEEKRRKLRRSSRK